jgi:preprotein translocase subunit SecE
MDKLKIALAVGCVVGGVFAYYWFSDLAVVLRVLMVLAGIALGAAVAYTSEQGKHFFAFAQEAWAEAGRVSWPARKETVQTTGVVFAFVVDMALFLFAVDSSLALVVQMIRGTA